MVSRSEFADVTARYESLQAQLADFKAESWRTIDEQRTHLSSLEAEKTRLLTTMQVDAVRGHGRRKILCSLMLRTFSTGDGPSHQTPLSPVRAGCCAGRESEWLEQSGGSDEPARHGLGAAESINCRGGRDAISTERDGVSVRVNGLRGSVQFHTRANDELHQETL